MAAYPKLLIPILWVALLLAPLFSGVSVYAQTEDSQNTQNTAAPSNSENATLSPAETSPIIVNGLCQGANLEVGSTCEQSSLNDKQAGETVNKLIANIINVLSLIVGVVAVIMIIIGGLRYITSGGDSSNVTSAKNTILYAIIGLIIVALAQVIVRFILGRLAET